MQSEIDEFLAELYSSNQKLAEYLLEKQIISADQLEKLLGKLLIFSLLLLQFRKLI